MAERRRDRQLEWERLKSDTEVTKVDGMLGDGETERRRKREDK